MGCQNSRLGCVGSQGGRMSDEMAEAYDRDYGDKERLRMLLDAINEFYVRSPPPRRASARTLEALGNAAAELEQDMARIVRTWD